MSTAAFQRLHDDQEEESAIKQQAEGSRAISYIAWVRMIFTACAAACIPLLIALLTQWWAPGPVSDATGKGAVASAAMLGLSFIGYGAAVPIRLLAAFQHLAAGLLISSVAVELVPLMIAAPRGAASTTAIVFGFVGGTAAFFALGAYCSAPEDEADAATPTESAAPAASPRSPRTTPRGTPRLTKLGHVQRAAALPTPPYPGALVAAVLVDSAVDGMLIGLASAAAAAEDVGSAGVVLAIALAIEMGFTGLAFAASLRRQPTAIGLISVLAPPLVLLCTSALGALAASMLEGAPSAHLGVISFGTTALLYLVVVELLREAHAGMGDEETTLIELMFFVGFFVALLLERAMQ